MYDPDNMKLSSESSSAKVVSGAFKAVGKPRRTNSKFNFDEIISTKLTIIWSVGYVGIYEYDYNYNAAVVVSQAFFFSDFEEIIESCYQDNVLEKQILIDKIKSYLDSVNTYASLDEVVFVDGIISTYAIPPLVSTGLLPHDTIRMDVSVVESNTGLIYRYLIEI